MPRFGITLLLARLTSLSALLFLIGTSVAQTDPAAGIQPFSTQLVGPVDSVDLATGNIFIRIPVRSKIGALPFSYSLVGNFHTYRYQDSQGYWWWTVSSGISGVQTGVAGASLPYTLLYQNVAGCSPDTEFVFSAVVDSSGASHPIPNTRTDLNGCLSLPKGVTTTDGSGFTVDFTGRSGANIYDKSGNKLSGLVIADPDGNKITRTNQNSYIDTLGAVALTTPYSSAPNPAQFTYNDANSNPQTYEIDYTSFTGKTIYGCVGVGEGGVSSNGLPTTIKIPGSAPILISYEPTPGYPTYITGRIAKITLPSGGSVSYSYSGGNYGISCPGTSTPTTITRTLDDAKGHVSTWTYVKSNTAGNFTVTETDPANNTITHSFWNEYETQRVVQDANLKTLSTTVTCYNGNFTNCTVWQPANPIHQITQTDVYSYPNGSSLPSLVQTQFDTYGNVTDVKNYDFGATYPPTGTPLSETVTLFDNGSNCGAALLNYIRNRPCLVTNYDFSGAPTSQMRYIYNAGGHATETDKWVSGSTYLKSYATYNTNGALTSTTDVNGAVTRYDKTQPACNSWLPTTISFPIVGDSTPSWDCNGSVVTQSKDVNQQPTNYTYNDPLWRITSVTDPLLTLTTIKYPTATTVESSLVFNSSTVDTLSTTDGLGRLISTQNMTAPNSGYDNFVQYGYGWNSTGAFTTKLMPGAASPTTTQMDAAGRTKTITDGGGAVTSYTYSQNDVLIAGPSSSRQIEYDGIGRIKSVCEISIQTGSASCGQNTTAIGFLTTYSYGTNSVTVIQNKLGTSQQRSYYYDGIGRLTSETNPESRTTTYTYDTVPASCYNFGDNQLGNLVSKNDANGNLICYHHDPLHRLADVGNNNQSTINAVRRFRYDLPANGVVAQPSGASLSNTAGRLIEAETDNGSTITDEWFSYSPRGELTGVYELTPNSNGYYHTTASYFANGAVQTLSGVPQHTAGWTHNVDGEGRPWTVTDNTAPADLVTRTSYNTASQPIDVVLGDLGAQGGDSYRYDANTGRITQYSFNVAAGFTNLLYESQAMADNSYWRGMGNGAFSTWVIGNSATDPNGGQTGSTIQFQANPNRPPQVSGIEQLIMPRTVAGQTFTFSVYLKADSAQSLYIGWQAAANSGWNGKSYLADTNASVTTTWARFVVTGTVPSSGTTNQITVFLQSLSATTNQTIYAWGAQFQLGSQTTYQPTGNGDDPFSVAGNLTWNTNGTLRQLAIFDPFDTANNQTCKYGYDDLGRAASVDCGASTWQQNFTYDPFGNITKTVPPGGTGGSWQPGYNQTNNHVALGGTSYDLDGNLLNDSFHQYSWNSYGNVASIDAIPITYDALGRMVENGSGQILYSPIGKLALMNGQTTRDIFLRLPGGEQATYTGSAILFRHYDWLGTSRFESDTSDNEYGDVAYSPFGEPYSIKDTPYLSFTGQQQDTVAGTYDFEYREYNPYQGRWISPDPAGLQAVDFSNPQTLNRYTYALNNPLSFKDPTGLYCVYYGESDLSDDGASYDFHSDKKTCEGNGPEGGGKWFDDPTTTVTVNGATGNVDTISTFTGNDVSIPLVTTQIFHDPGCANKPAIAPQAPPNYIENQVAKQANWSFLQFVWQSRTGGELDPKTILNDDSLDPLGNYQFGVICNARGISLVNCESGAGVYQIYSDLKVLRKKGIWQRTGSGTPEYSFPYGDRTKDSLEITAGYSQAAYYRNCNN